MAAAATDNLIKVGTPGTATTLAAPGYTIGDGSITVVSTTNWPSDTGVAFAIDVVETVNGVETRVDGSYCEFVGTVASATSIANVSKTYGTAQDYAAGATTRVYIPVSSTRENRIVTWGLTEHNQDGSHADVDCTTMDATGNASVGGTLGVTGTATFTGTAQAATVIATGDIQHRSISLETIRSEQTFDYVASGCVWTGDAYGSTRAASMTAGVVYIGGRRVAVSAVTARTFTASKDTYIDVGTDGTVDYAEENNNAASTALAAGHIRLGIIVTGAGNIANAGSVNQGQEDKVLPIASSVPYAVTDSLGNLICPRDPQRKLLGYRQITSAFTSSTIAGVAVTGLSVPAIVPTGRKIQASCGSNAVGKSGAASESLAISIKEDTTVINSLALSITGNNWNMNGNIPPRPTTTTAGLHTYTVELSSANAGTMFMACAVTAPAYLKVELE